MMNSIVLNPFFEKINQKFYHLQFTNKRQQAFLEDLSSLIEDGVPASQAIDVIVEVGDGITVAVAKTISKSLAKGQSLADGMQQWFSAPVVEVIRVGESNGTLTETMKAAAETYSDYTTVLNAFLSSILYPASVVVLALIMIVFIKHSVLNSFIEIKPLAQWPTIGKNLYRIGYIVETGWWLMVMTLVFLGIIINNVLKNVTGSLRAWLDDVPLIALYRASLAARFMETLGLLIANGVVLKQALSTMQYGASPYLSWHLLQMEYHLSGGQENIADVLNTNLISYHDLARLRVVARGKGFEHALVSLGRQARRRTAVRIDRTGKIIGALLLVVGAIIAMTIVFGIYTIGSSLAV